MKLIRIQIEEKENEEFFFVYIYTQKEKFFEHSEKLKEFNDLNEAVKFAVDYPDYNYVGIYKGDKELDQDVCIMPNRLIM